MLFFLPRVIKKNTSFFFGIARLTGNDLWSKVVSETPFKININDVEHRARAGIHEADVTLMLQDFLNAGVNINLEN
ncbi:hypothetical protein KCA24_36700 [Escherichia coli]|nr:hypothetical protein [Escherichia coli]